MPRKSDPKPKARKPRKLPPIETENLTYKQRMFIEFFLGEASGNATEAARLAGYAFPNDDGPKNLVKPCIKAAIDARLGGVALTTNEILARLSEQATADIGDFIVLTATGKPTFDLRAVKAAGLTRLIKRIIPGKFGVTVELHDSQSALEKLAKFRGLLKDRIEVETGDADPLKSQEAAAVLAEMARKSEDHTDGEEKDQSD